MRLIKMFGLAAIVAGTFVVFLGTTAASAITSLEEVVLCKTNEDPCENGHFDSGTVLHGSATNPLLHGSLFNITCETSHVLGKLISLLTYGEITSLSFLNCTREDTGATCTSTAQRLSYLAQAELDSSHSGYEVLVKAGLIGLRPEVRVQCGSIDCKYGSDHTIFTIEDTALTGVLNVSQVMSGLGFCFTSATWLASYTVKCLENSIAAGCWPGMEFPVELKEVVLCKTNEDPCNSGHFESGAVLHGSAANPLLHGSLFDIQCTTSHVLGELKSSLAHGEITALSFLSCEREDTGATCTTTVERLNYLIKAELDSSHSGYEVLVKAGPNGLRPEVRVQCGSIDCRYGSDHLIFEVLNASLTAVLDAEQELNGLGFCFTTAEWLASYTVKCLSGSISVGCWVRME